MVSLIGLTNLAHTFVVLVFGKKLVKELQGILGLACICLSILASLNALDQVGVNCAKSTNQF